MKVVQVVAGAGGMYCGACARDAGLARALGCLGHEATILPVYTPLRLEKDLSAPTMPLHLGGIGAYLRERFANFDSWPRGLRTWLDHPALIGWASRFAVRTQASDLGPMTVSVLSGVEGRHKLEIERTACDLAVELPSVVILANSLLSSLATPIVQATGARVLCQVQGEDGFLSELPSEYREPAIEWIRRHASSIGGFLAPSECHAQKMAETIGIEPARFHVVPHFVNIPELLPPLRTERLVIGCLSSIRRAKGQDLLIRAAASIRSLPIQVLLAGRSLEPSYERELRALADPERVRFLGELSPSQKQIFYGQCDAVCLPSRLDESRGVAALEALASGKPLFASDRGVFREFASKAVMLFEADDAESLANRISQKAADKLELARLGEAGREYVRNEHSLSRTMAALSAALA